MAEELGVTKPTALSQIKLMGIKYSIPTQIPQLNQNHIKKRFDYAQQLVGKKVDDLIFIDESYFQLYRNTFGNWHYEDECNFTTKPQTRIRFMVYGAISYYGKSELHIYDQGFSINSEGYCQILSQILIPFAEDYYESYKRTRKERQFKDWYLIHDNVPSHKSKYTTKFLIENTIETLNHPPNSPDLNPIELIWAILKKRVEKQKPTNQENLKAIIVEQWNLIELDIIQSCISHFQSRIEYVYKLEGKFY
ncbi:hypothetical protein ABPG72_019966 [Tetrahymena utriculariae]